MEELEATKEDLEVRIANEKIAKPKVTEDHLKSYFHRFRGMDMRIQKNRQMLIDSFINRIYLYDDGRLVIYCNHKDGAETITLEDVETALAEAGFGSDLVSFAVPKNPDTLWVSGFFNALEKGTRTIKCGADERRSRGLDRATPLFSPAPAGENANESLSASLLFIGTPKGRTRKDGTSAHTGAKSVRWTLFSPWESPNKQGCIPEGC